MDKKYLAMLNTVYTDGSVAEIIAAELVENPEAGEWWHYNTRPLDGTRVDYTLHELAKIRQRPKTKAP